jgi:N-acetylglucosaminyldiphosphoundecaprenol N-acetyl-beta-D-mannosaminyltransferase
LTANAEENALTGDDRHSAVDGLFVPRPQQRQPVGVGEPRRWRATPRTSTDVGATTERRRVHAGKWSVLGVLVNALDYDVATGRVLDAARHRRPLSLSALAVHGVMTGVHDRAHNARLNSIDVVVPDGQPVRWALNLLHGTELRDWVSGPELVLRVLRRMAGEGLGVYLYGADAETLDRLSSSLPRLIPGLRIDGMEPSRFRDALPGEQAAIAERIRASGARLVLVGLGCPRQETFVYGMRRLVDVPLMAVGAAFDYHSGRLRPAPRWMQRHGLAWLWRLSSEPRRLWRRYLPSNVEYLARLAAQKTGVWRPEPPEPTDRWPELFPI